MDENTYTVFCESALRYKDVKFFTNYSSCVSEKWYFILLVCEADTALLAFVGTWSTQSKQIILMGKSKSDDLKWCPLGNLVWF